MSVVIISKNGLFAALLAEFCSANGSNESCVEVSLDRIEVLSPGSFVLIHIEGEILVADEQAIANFRACFPDAKLLALVPDDFDRQSVASNFEAILPFNTEPHAVLSFLTVLNSGYRVIPSEDQNALSELDGVKPIKDTRSLHAQLLERPAAVSKVINHGQVNLPKPITQGSAAPPFHFTERELQTMALLRNGASNKEIATKLRIEENTVKVHLRSCFSKMGVRNRTQAALWAADNL